MYAHSASVSHPTSPDRPNPFIHTFKRFKPSLMVLHLSTPLPRFSTTNKRFSATNKALPSPQALSPWFVYDITGKSWGQNALAADCARLGLSQLEEVCAPRNVGSFHSYIHIEATQMTEEHQHTRTTSPTMDIPLNTHHNTRAHKTSDAPGPTFSAIYAASSSEALWR